MRSSHEGGGDNNDSNYIATLFLLESFSGKNGKIKKRMTGVINILELLHQGSSCVTPNSSTSQEI